MLLNIEIPKLSADKSAWTCEECVNGVSQIAGIISDPATVDSVIAFLKVGHIMSLVSLTALISQGADFCGTTGDEATCGAVILS